VGANTAELVAEAFGSMQALRKATVERLTELDGVGPEVADGLVRFFASEEGARAIDRLADAGVSMTQAAGKRKTLDGPLSGKTVVVTGTLERMSRTEAQDLIKQAGGRVTGSVSSRTDLVVFGASPGSKLEKARQLGVSTVDETAFLQMLAL
ncbi:MAG: BRCT domain-containing protein, partial [Phycisphaerae bacterium]